MTHKSSPTWTVLRHSGRYGDPFKVRFQGSPEQARRVYDRIAAEIKQGAVQLSDSLGNLVAYETDRGRPR